MYLKVRQLLIYICQDNDHLYVKGFEFPMLTFAVATFL